MKLIQYITGIASLWKAKQQKAQLVRGGPASVFRENGIWKVSWTHYDEWSTSRKQSLTDVNDRRVVE